MYPHHKTQVFNIQFNIILPYMPRSPQVISSLRDFLLKFSVSHLSSACHMHRPSHHPWLHCQNTTSRIIQIMKLVM